MNITKNIGSPNDNTACQNEEPISCHNQYVDEVTVNGGTQCELNDVMRHEDDIVHEEKDVTPSHGHEEGKEEDVVSVNSQVVMNHGAFTYWHNNLQSAKYILAPMVDASELAWRMLSRRYGAQLCYTPMLHANIFVKDSRYRADSLVTCHDDRPLIVQFCANDSDTLVKAATLAAPYCDGIDLNLGCPQAIARRGNYGAFLQDDWHLITNMIRACRDQVSVPITAKIRVFPDIEKTVRYARMLEAAGCAVLTVHGRTREQKGMQTGLADWNYIKAVKESVGIPVFANGNIQYLEDAEKCVKVTGVEGVMSAEGNLHNPAIFHGINPPIFQMAEEYLELVHQYPCPLSYARGHLFKLFQQFLPLHHDLRDMLSSTHELLGLEQVTALVKARCLQAQSQPDAKPHDNGLVANLKLPYWLCQPYERPKVELDTGTDCEKPRTKRPVQETDDILINGKRASRNQLKKLRRNPNKRFQSQSPDYVICATCRNPRGLKCPYDLCRACCRLAAYHQSRDCTGHGFMFKTKRQHQKLNATAEPETPS